MAWAEVSTGTAGWSAVATGGVLAATLHEGMPSGLLLAITYSTESTVTGPKTWALVSTNTDGWTEV